MGATGRRISSARASEVDMDESRSQFEVLLEPHREVLRGYVYRLVGHPADAEDLIQEITVKAFERLESLRSSGAFRSWLFRIATSTCLDHLRKQARWRPYSQSYAEQECAESPELRAEVNATLTDPDFEYDAREHMAFCFTCVGRSLEPPQQAAIVLREILGFSNQEAADTLGVSESVLRHHLSAGRALDGGNLRGTLRPREQARNVSPVRGLSQQHARAEARTRVACAAERREPVAGTSRGRSRHPFRRRGRDLAPRSHLRAHS